MGGCRAGRCGCTLSSLRSCTTWTSPRRTNFSRLLLQESYPCILHSPISVTGTFSFDSGGEFLIKNFKIPDVGKIYFSTNVYGEPSKIQRTLFGEVYYVMAMSGLVNATGDKKFWVICVACFPLRASLSGSFQIEAVDMFRRILHWAREDDSVLGRPKLSGAASSVNLATPGLILNLVRPAHTPFLCYGS